VRVVVTEIRRKSKVNYHNNGTTAGGRRVTRHCATVEDSARGVGMDFRGTIRTAGGGKRRLGIYATCARVECGQDVSSAVRKRGKSYGFWLGTITARADRRRTGRDFFFLSFSTRHFFFFFYSFFSYLIVSLAHTRQQ